MIKSVQLFLDGDEGKEDIDFDELDINNDEEKEELVINELSECIRDVVRGFRWNPTLAMLARLLELRDFITETENSRADFKISEIQWIGIQGISSVLEPARKASVREVEEIDTVFAKAFSAALQTRENTLMDNDISRSAIYLDPRFKVNLILSTDERVKAKAYLINPWQTVHQMRLDRESNNNSFPHGQVESLIEPLDKLESALRERENSIVSPTFAIENQQLDHRLENLKVTRE
ncbi:uncharacterized protein LOC123470679 [Daphnia magna]|uniref:uncharacterized protein LOC123470679 n=1 Tax=Daphnia magna TaxID=35525 RepID=UPI001E1BC566|nr:uncharacterized protein LOC123470679 [Daphnia magna]